MTTKQFEETLTMLVGKAKALRDVGVVGQVSIGNVSFCLAPSESAPTALQTQHDDGRGNALDDPATYGGYVPHRRGSEEAEADEPD